MALALMHTSKNMMTPVLGLFEKRLFFSRLKLNGFWSDLCGPEGREKFWISGPFRHHFQLNFRVSIGVGQG